MRSFQIRIKTQIELQRVQRSCCYSSPKPKGLIPASRTCLVRETDLQSSHWTYTVLFLVRFRFQPPQTPSATFASMCEKPSGPQILPALLYLSKKHMHIIFHTETMRHMMIFYLKAKERNQETLMRCLSSWNWHLEEPTSWSAPSLSAWYRSHMKCHHLGKSLQFYHLLRLFCSLFCSYSLSPLFVVLFLNFLVWGNPLNTPN